jgi:hypothetical protein
MAAKKQKAKSKRPSPPSARSRSSPGSAVIGTIFNMAATLGTFASVLLCQSASKFGSDAILVQLLLRAD